MRPTLLDIPYVKARDVRAYLTEALTYLIKNGQVIIRDSKLRDIASQRLFSSTPVNKLFRGIAVSGKIENFLFLDYSATADSNVPEILTADDLCIDGGAITNPPVPAFARKCWINITPILGKKDAYNDNLFFTDTSQLAQLVTRAALCQAYNDKDMWLTVKQALFSIELYATIMAQVITNTYTLNPDERRFIMTLFALYAAQLTGPANADKRIPPMIMRCPFLGSGADIMQVVEASEPYLPKEGDHELSLPTIVNIINNIGPSRMKNYTIQMLYRSMSASSIDSSTMVIALDYPPYWVYQLLRVASGYKNPIVSGIVKTLGLKNKLQGFADDVADNPNLIQSLMR